MRNTLKATLVAGLAVIALASAFVFTRVDEQTTPLHAASIPISPPEIAQPRVEPPSTPADAPYRTASVTVTPPSAPKTLDEPAIMSTLRQLGDSEPQRSLELARDGNTRFSGSPDAAEREWYVCKSLVNLQNFYDARDEARRMVTEYPDTPWTLDVQRHLLTNPLDLPGDPAP
jgi:hypothetical protein